VEKWLFGCIRPLWWTIELPHVSWTRGWGTVSAYRMVTRRFVSSPCLAYLWHRRPACDPPGWAPVPQRSWGLANPHDEAWRHTRGERLRRTLRNADDAVAGPSEKARVRLTETGPGGKVYCAESASPSRDGPRPTDLSARVHTCRDSPPWPI